MNTKLYYEYCSKVLNGEIIAGETIKLACKRFQNDLKRDDLEFREDKVDRAILFISTLKHYTGKHSGKPFTLEGWQQFIIANIVGFYWKGTTTRRYTSSYIEVSRKQGKALSLDTVIPTPSGWTTMGELKEGDYVLGRDGFPTQVTFITPIQYNRNCYKITFEDGEQIIADADHQWLIRQKDNKERVLTTKDLLHFKRERKDAKGTEYLYRVPMNKPLDLPYKELPIHPYVLGLWLGDGTSKKPEFTVCEDDLEMYEPLKDIYGDYKLHRDSRNTKTLTVSFTGDRGQNNSILRNQLIQAGVFGNKHIPSEYLRASKEQRLALLQGLMDTDGCISKSGQCEFIQKSNIISDGLCELLSSLGIKYNRVKKIPTINGKECNEVNRITFFTDKSLPCFRLKRKYDRLKESLNKRMLYKSIVDITKVDSVPVKCIQVDNKDSLYLAGKHFTVTHNTALAAALCLYYLIADGEDGAEVLLAANSKEQAKIAFDMCSKFSKGLDSKGKYLTAYRADILFNLTNSKLKVLAADDSKLDGFNASFGLLDEYHAAKNSKVRDVIKSSMGMRMNPHLCTITTAGFDKTLPCYQLRTVAIEVLNGLKIDDEMFIAIYSLDTEDDWREEKNWIKCAPNLDITVTSKYIKGQVRQAINNPADEVGVKTKTLNLWCDSSNVWLPEDYIVKASKPVDLDSFNGLDCYVGVDLAATSDLTAVSYLVVKDGTYYFKTHYYLPESALKDKTDKELYKYWKQQGYLTVTSGNVTDYDYITNDMLKYADVVNIQSVGYDKYNATQWAINSTEQGLPLEEYPQTLGNFNMPTRELERLILSGKAVIDNNEINRYCFRNVTLKSDYNGNVKPNKAVDKKKIDGTIAMIQALGMYLRNPRFSNEIITI